MTDISPNVKRTAKESPVGREATTGELTSMGYSLPGPDIFASTPDGRLWREMPLVSSPLKPEMLESVRSNPQLIFMLDHLAQLSERDVDLENSSHELANSSHELAATRHSLKLANENLERSGEIIRRLRFKQEEALSQMKISLSQMQISLTQAVDDRGSAMTQRDQAVTNLSTMEYSLEVSRGMCIALCVFFSAISWLLGATTFELVKGLILGQH